MSGMDGFVPEHATVIGIDQSMTSTGIFAGNTEHPAWQWRIIETKKSSTPMDSTEQQLDDVKRCREIVCEVIKFVSHASDRSPLHKLIVCIEGLGFGAKGDATRKLAGLQFMILSALQECEMYDELLIVPPTTLKKFATGKGNAKKEAMFEALPDDARMFFEENTLKTKGRYDVTDAYWLTNYALDQFRNEKDGDG